MEGARGPDHLYRGARLRRAPGDAPAPRLPRRALFGALRRLRHRAGGQDADRRLRGRVRRGAHGLGLGGARRGDLRVGRVRRSSTALRPSPSAATRSSRGWRSTSSPPASRPSSARPGTARAGARRNCPRLRASGRSCCRARGRFRSVPVLGPLYSELVSGHSLIVYAAAAAVPLTWWVIYRTRFGLRLRAVGENPAAVDTAGVSVRVAALPRRHRLRRAVRARRRVSLDRAIGRLQPRHDGRQGLHRARRPHLRQMAALAGARRLLPLRLPGRRRHPDAGRRRCPVVGQVPVQFMQALPYVLDRRSCSRASSAGRCRRRPAASLT